MAPRLVKIWDNKDLKAVYTEWHLEKFGDGWGNQADAGRYFAVGRRFINRVLDPTDITIPNKEMRNQIKMKKGPRGCWVPFDEDDVE